MHSANPMNKVEQTHPAAPGLAAAICAERTAQNAYAKFFFEVEESQSDAIALLRLHHTNCTRLLENELLAMQSALPEYTESEGPFANDPRKDVFDIDYQLIIDYLKSSERALSEIWRQIAETNETIETALNSRDEKIEKLLADLERQIGVSTKMTRGRREPDQLARCGLGA